MPRIAYNLAEEENKLEGFLLSMADEEQPVFVELVQQIGYGLTRNYALDSLEELERYVRDKKLSFENATDAALKERTNCWFYLGEVVRANFGGYWRFSMSEENSLHWGAYVLEGYAPVKGVEFEPLGLLKRFIARGFPSGAFRRAIMADVAPTALDLSNFPTEQELK